MSKVEILNWIVLFLFIIAGISITIAQFQYRRRTGNVHILPISFKHFNKKEFIYWLVGVIALIICVIILMIV